MPVSDRKRAANQANARKSTGPTSAEGKQRSRLNALKHGLRAEQVVLPGEDPAAFEAERAAWFDDWKPRSQTRAVLVERAAVQAWRLRRCVRVEAANLDAIARKAADDYDRAVSRRVDAKLDLLDQHPRRAFELLEDDPEGIAALIHLWNELITTLADPTAWTRCDIHHGRLLTLLGHPCHVEAADTGEDEPLVEMSLRLVITNSPEEGNDPDGPLSPETAARVASTIRRIAEGRAAGLHAALKEFEDPAIHRARRIEAACFDDSDRGRQLSRYEATLDRSFRATVNQLVTLAKSGIDEIEALEPEPVASDEPAPPNEATASAPIEATASAPIEATVSAPIEATVSAPIEATALSETVPSRASGRDRRGRVREVGAVGSVDEGGVSG